MLIWKGCETLISCNVIKDLIGLYIDDVLSDNSKKLVENHINECEECKIYLERMKDDVNIEINDEVIKDRGTEIALDIQKHQRNKILAISIILGIIAALFTSNDMIFKSFLIMPAVGAFLYLKYKSIFLGPVIILILKTVSITVETLILISDSSYDYIWSNYIAFVLGSFGVAILFSALTFVGVFIGFLIKKIFLEK